MHFFLLISIYLISFLSPEALVGKSVAISVAPYLEVVKELAGENIQVHLVVPAGSSSHTFEATPKQLTELREASIWFIIGEPFEQKAIHSFKGQNQKPLIVDLRKGLHLINGSCGCCHHHNHDHDSDFDPHIWMDPQMMITQVSTICSALIQTFPEEEATIRMGEKKVLQLLTALDKKIHEFLYSKHGTLIVSHPAYGYLLRPYPSIHQFPLEHEGREPSAKQFENVFTTIEKAHAHTIFTQKEYPSRAALRIAEKLKLNTVELEPYSQSYFTSLDAIAEAFSCELRLQEADEKSLKENSDGES